MLERQKVGRLATTLTIIASACAPGTAPPDPESNPPNPPSNFVLPSRAARDCQIPADRRAILPEAIARATETACYETAIGTPIPSHEKKEPTIENIKIERELFTRCKPNQSTDPQGNDLWGGWTVRLDSTTHYLERAKANVELKTSSGLTISKNTLQDIGLAPNSIGYIPAFITPNPKQRSMGAGLEFYLSGKGSQLNSVKLEITGLTWKRVDESPKEYKWEANFQGTGHGAMRSPYSNEYYSYNPRSFAVEFSNQGERLIKGLSIFGFLINGGDLIDIMWGGNTDIPYGQKKLIHSASVSNSGRCALSGNPALETELIWWAGFNTHTGMPVEKYEQTKIALW